LSKVIKAAQWEERPMVIKAPEPPKIKTSKDGRDAAGAGEQKPEFDVKAYKRRLAAVAAKEKRAAALMQKAKAESEKILQHAKNERDRLMAEARQECVELREDAARLGHEEGMRRGEEEGRDEAKKAMKEAIQNANKQAEKTLQDAKDATSDYLAKAEDDVTSIALAIVEKILPQHFIDVPQVILPLVQKSLEKVKDQKEINIHVAPDVYDLVLLARDEFRSRLTGTGAELTITSDESLVPGDCVIETPNGGVDARLQTQIELIRQAIEEVKA